MLDPVHRDWDELLAHARRRGRVLRRRRRVLLALPLAAVAAVAAGVVVASPPAPESVEVVDDGGVPDQTPPPASVSSLPAIAFARVFADGGSALYVVNADGTNLRRLTEDASWQEGGPAWSPDGDWIAFSSQRDNALAAAGKTVMDVYLVRPDGTGLRRVTTTADPGLGSGVRHPAWSPDGSLLAVAAEDAADASRILVLAPDGSGGRAVTDGPGDVFPSWSPDGRRIAFQRDGSGIWVVGADGTGERRVAEAGTPSRVAWTPDGTQLTFERPRPGGGSELVTVDVDGGEPTVVSAGTARTAGDAGWVRPAGPVAYTADGAIVVAEPGRPPLASVTRPPRGGVDVNASFAPPGTRV